MPVSDYISYLTKEIPIRRKLLLIVLVTTNIALLLASAAVVFYDRQSEKQSMSRELGILTQVIAQRSTAALTFDDKQLAAENLQTLSGNPAILTACIYNADNKLFSKFHNKTHDTQKCEPTSLNIKTGFIQNNYLEHQEIKLDDSLVGFIYIKSSLEEIDKRLTDYIIFVGILFVITSFLAFLLAMKLQKLITDPIHDLAIASRDIYGNKDYSIRVKKTTNDEVGRLVDAFNDMLSGIEERDAALVDAKNNLEHIVKERTQKLKEAQDELVRTERMAALGQLTATVSHEIRNPLGTIRTSVFTLSNKLKEKEPDLVKVIERIERNIIRCDNIITELLDFSRIKALNHERTNLSSWVRSILMDMTIPEPVKLKIDLNDLIDIEIDRDLLQRVIINIIENAYQAITKKDNSDNTITLQSNVTDSRTEIVISDTGPGIPDEIYPHIFEPLYSTKGFGMGLGLPVVKQIMEQHGGGVEIISEKNIGTKVVLWLPATLNISKGMAS